MKPQDKAPYIIGTSFVVGVVAALSGFPIPAAAVVLVGLALGSAAWSPVREGREKALAYQDAYETEKRWHGIRMGSIEPKKSEQWVRDATFDEWINALFDLWLEKVGRLKARERIYYYLKGSGFIVQKAEGEPDSDSNDDELPEMDNVKYRSGEEVEL